MFFCFIVFVNLLPLTIPLYKVYYRKDLNLFDFLMVFEAVFFLFIPLFKEIKSDDEILFRYFIIYTTFNYLSWSIGYLVDRLGRDTMLNITRYLSRYKDFEINKTGQILLLLALIVIFAYYLPTQSLVLRFGQSRAVLSYSQSSIYLLLGAMNFIVSIIISLVIVFDFFNNRKNIFNIILFTFFIIIALLGVRRDLIFSLLVFFVIIYSVRRDLFNRKFIIILSCATSFLLLIYFPFYNIIRISPVIFDTNRPVESVIDIINYGIDNYDSKIDDASDSTDKRSLGLYNALYKACEKKPECQWGTITISFIEKAIPRFISPNKASVEGGGDIITKSLGTNKDIADSVLLSGVCEFGAFGGFYAAFMFLFVFIMYSLYSRIIEICTSSVFVPVYIVFYLFNICWNVEVLMTSFFSWFFSSLPIIVILYMFEKYHLIEVKMKFETE